MISRSTSWRPRVAARSGQSHDCRGETPTQASQNKRTRSSAEMAMDSLSRLLSPRFMSEVVLTCMESVCDDEKSTVVPVTQNGLCLCEGWRRVLRQILRLRWVCRSWRSYAKSPAFWRRLLAHQVFSGPWRLEKQWPLPNVTPATLLWHRIMLVVMRRQWREQIDSGAVMAFVSTRQHFQKRLRHEFFRVLDEAWSESGPHGRNLLYQFSILKGGLTVMMLGPPDSLLSGCALELAIDVNAGSFGYPIGEPAMRFVQAPPHPNISSATGMVDIHEHDGFSSAMTLESLVISILAFLGETPSTCSIGKPNHPVDLDAHNRLTQQSHVTAMLSSSELFKINVAKRPFKDWPLIGAGVRVDATWAGNGVGGSANGGLGGATDNIRCICKRAVQGVDDPHLDAILDDCLFKLLGIDPQLRAMIASDLQGPVVRTLGLFI